MPRRASGNRGNGKAVIVVFCEGESEQAYTEYLKKRFADVAVIKYPKETGLFERAESRFAKDPQYRDYAEVTDEVWFFFDVETKDVDLWNQRMKIIKKLRKLRKDPNIRVRLLMTTGCVEYWFMLHFKMYAPPLQTVAEKERVISELLEKGTGIQKRRLSIYRKNRGKLSDCYDPCKIDYAQFAARGSAGAGGYG